MRIIVTGGAGFIGSHLVDRLLTDGAEVVVVDNFDSFYPRAVKLSNLAPALHNERCRLVELDIRDGPGVKRLVEESRPDAIVHLAARRAFAPASTTPRFTPTSTCWAPSTGWKPRRDLSRDRGSFTHRARASTATGPDAPFRETDPVDLPVSPYAATKKACELLAFTFHHLHGLPVTGLRFFTAFGPRNRPDLAIAKFTRLIERGEPVPMFGDGTTRRDYTYVGDIVDGIVRAVDRCTGHHLYNLGNSSPIELARAD